MLFFSLSTRAKTTTNISAGTYSNKSGCTITVKKIGSNGHEPLPSETYTSIMIEKVSSNYNYNKIEHGTTLVSFDLTKSKVDDLSLCKDSDLRYPIKITMNKRKNTTAYSFSCGGGFLEAIEASLSFVVDNKTNDLLSIESFEKMPRFSWIGGFIPGFWELSENIQCDKLKRDPA